jgi:hypothetical protein
MTRFEATFDLNLSEECQLSVPFVQTEPQEPDEDCEGLCMREIARHQVMADVMAIRGNMRLGQCVTSIANQPSAKPIMRGARRGGTRARLPRDVEHEKSRDRAAEDGCGLELEVESQFAATAAYQGEGDEGGPDDRRRDFAQETRSRTRRAKCRTAQITYRLAIVRRRGSSAPMRVECFKPTGR